MIRRARPVIVEFCERADGTRLRQFEFDGCRVTVEPPANNDAEGKRAATRLAIRAGVLPRQRPFGDIWARRLPSGTIFAAGRQTRGLGEFGYEHDSWADLLGEWDVEPVEVGRDQFGEYVRLRPVKAGGAS